jgi:hypothetical protein
MASPAMLVIDNANGRLLRGDTLEMILSEGAATSPARSVGSCHCAQQNLPDG